MKEDLQLVVNELRPNEDVLAGLDSIAGTLKNDNEICSVLWAIDKNEVGFKSDEQEEFFHEFLIEVNSIPSWRHPLLIDVFPIENWRTAARYGWMVQKKCELLESLVEGRNFSNFVFLHERPFRLDALLSVVIAADEKFKTTNEYWELLDHVWTDSEDPCGFNENIEVWRRLWNNNYEGTTKTNDHCGGADTLAYESLPDDVVVYRAGDLSGLSWTTNKETAVLFWERKGRNVPVWTGVIKKSDILWFSNARGESEIIVTDFSTLGGVSEIHV